MESIEQIKSPLNGESEVILEKKIKVSTLVKAYKKSLNINVKKYYKDLDYIDIYICKDSGYRFYYPFDIAGDSDFYIHLQQYAWYYMSWKWEHEMCLKLINPGDKVLEIGSGKGSFLKKISEIQNVNCVGLELNEDSAFETQNIKLINATIEDFSEKNKEQFDLVCSFQVLEHISFVQKFLNASIECLKKGGKLVVCVPNNDSFLKYDSGVLNAPPHHMGLWDENSLRSIEKYYPVKLDKIIFEPLQPYHVSNYLHAIVKGKIGLSPKKVVLKLLSIIGVKKIIEKSLLKRADSIKGHSIMAIFIKI